MAMSLRNEDIMHFGVFCYAQGEHIKLLHGV
jgi:hypothetical protein